jgi:hypothetical protein
MTQVPERPCLRDLVASLPAQGQDLPHVPGRLFVSAQPLLDHCQGIQIDNLHGNVRGNVQRLSCEAGALLIMALLEVDGA